MREIGQVIVAALREEVSDAELEALRARSRAVGERFPIYPGLPAASAVA